MGPRVAALAYLSHAGVRDLARAVVLQRMVQADAAGVLFTAPPPGLASETWHPEERLVNATLGLVEAAAPEASARAAALAQLANLVT